MKTLFRVFNVFFTICGAVVGAGFLSGAEPVGFFGSQGYLIPALLAGITFAVFFCAFFSADKNGSAGKIGEGGGFFYALTVLSDFILLSGMLAGLDAAVYGVKLISDLRLASLGSLAFAFVYSRRGGKGLEKINRVLTPVSIVVVNAFLIAAFFSGKYYTNAPTAASGVPAAGAVINAFLYAFMNVFAAIPAVRYCAEKNDKKTLSVASAAFGAFAFIETVFVLYTISRCGGAFFSEVPVIYAFNGSRYAVILKTAIFIGIFTSFYSFFLPVYDCVRLKKGKPAAYAVIAAAFVLSGIGFDKTIKYLYPVVGACGGAYFIKLARSLLKQGKSLPQKNAGIKIRPFSDNKRITKKGVRDMSKKKKNKVKKLTEEEYGKYLMALKDEVPPKPVRDLQE